jgi:hypothetical protein
MSADWLPRMLKLKNDNSHDPRWPERTIIAAATIENFLDDEPHAQRLNLSCGHWAINTFDGVKFPERHEGETLRCRTCWTEQRT